ncbi:hypothetical protein LCGC14_1038870 [marine sediment metagenome]|uniref:Tyr recombinase domain-containing protein n=1 Tax=marine sediment metagenome TaxID=412755 RepID=A0A0F9MSC5_9ZZZZ
MKIRDAIGRVLVMIDATKSKATYTTYESGLCKFERYLWNDEIYKVEHLQVPGTWIGYAEHLASLGYAPRSRTVYNAAAKQLLDWLVLHEHVTISEHGQMHYKHAISTYKGKVRTDPKVPDLEKVAAISKVAMHVIDNWQVNSYVEVRDATIFMFLLETGCRVGEVVEIKTEDIDFEGMSVVVTGKGDKTRNVMFGAKTYRALNNYDLRKGSIQGLPAYFLSCRKSKLTTHGVRLGVKRLVLRAKLYGFKLTPHMLRHAFATIALDRTGNLALIQDLLGHASPETTRVYARFTDRVKRSEYDQIWNEDE